MRRPRAHYDVIVMLRRHRAHYDVTVMKRAPPYLDLTDELYCCIYIYMCVCVCMCVCVKNGINPKCQVSRWKCKNFYFLHTGLIPDIRLFGTYTLIYQREIFCL